MEIYSQIQKKKANGKKQFAVLIDPDKLDDKQVREVAELALKARVDFFFIGGSLLINDSLDTCITTLKKETAIPVVLFPGNNMQLSYRADGILFLSLISGRNPEMLIGRHVIAAPYLRLSSLEVISTGYMLIESGRPTTVSYMSSSVPIPADKVDIACCTAMAGEMLGLKLIYMDAGSGALNPISDKMIQSVRSSISIPLIIGGGIRTPQLAETNCKAGADIIVVGNAIEKDASLITEIGAAIHSC
ncbi:MAG: geranylgeranylglyceryl/heptaprenylglyceryl phosphate synthase [Bacteroidota bacterium]|nr:geranylgeranylglyceryl/heptaprenylglyceryl phosphate synthase [Bacteroidota bacterium]